MRIAISFSLSCTDSLRLIDESRDESTGISPPVPAKGGKAQAQGRAGAVRRSIITQSDHQAFVEIVYLIDHPHVHKN
jgi:hypothetical protein